MLLTITYTGRDTENLGYLLYKNPYRPQVFELSYGKAYGSIKKIHRKRTALLHPRMRLRSPGTRKRTRRPKTITRQARQGDGSSVLSLCSGRLSKTRGRFICLFPRQGDGSSVLYPHIGRLKSQPCRPKASFYSISNWQCC